MLNTYSFRILFLILINAGVYTTQGQTITNGDMESWVGAGADCENPQFWDSANETLSFFFGLCSVEKETGMVQDGSTAARLTTKNVAGLGLIAPAAMALGTIVVDVSDPFNGSVAGGAPTWGLPTSLTFYYSYEPSGGDSMSLQLRMLDITGSDTTIISEDEFFTEVATGGTMQEVTLDINYLTSDEPELVQILARSTRDTDDAHPGSTLILDAFRLNGITAVDEIGSVSTPVIYPNPASEYIALSNELDDGLMFSVFSMSGQMRLNEKLRRGTNQFNIKALPAGIYTYRIVNANGALIRSGKLMKDQQ